LAKEVIMTGNKGLSISVVSAIVATASPVYATAAIQISSAQVVRDGQYTELSSSTETREQCAGFRLSNRAALRWLRRAKQVDRETWRERLSWSHCFASGTLVTREGQYYQWTIDPSGRGEITLSPTSSLYLNGKELHFSLGDH
jgi:hypothetical protein